MFLRESGPWNADSATSKHQIKELFQNAKLTNCIHRVYTTARLCSAVPGQTLKNRRLLSVPWMLLKRTKTMCTDRGILYKHYASICRKLRAI